MEKIVRNKINPTMLIYDHIPAVQSILNCVSCIFHNLRKVKVEGSILEYEMRFICECPEECTWEDHKFKRREYNEK